MNVPSSLRGKSFKEKTTFEKFIGRGAFAIVENPRGTSPRENTGVSFPHCGCIRLQRRHVCDTPSSKDPTRLAGRLLRGRGLAGSAENVLITSGSQQALDLAARALLDSGDAVVIESPSYLAALQIFDSCEACYRPIPLDEDGLLVEALPGALEGAKALYTLPNFQNPTGITMSLLAASVNGPVSETRVTPQPSHPGTVSHASVATRRKVVSTPSSLSSMLDKVVRLSMSRSG